MPLIYEWITEPDWGLSYQKFRDLLVNALISMDSVSELKAQQAVRKAFWGHLNNCLSTKFRIEYGNSLRKRFKKIRALVELKRLVTTILPVKPKISLASLLSKS